MSSQPKNITQTNTVKLSPQQQAVFDKAMPSIDAYAGSDPQLFPGTQLADFNPWETLGQNFAAGVAAPNAADLAGRAADTQKQLMDPGFMLNPNQYLQPAMQGVTNQVTQNLLENILPKIRSGSTVAGGQYSGGATRQGIAEGRAIGQTNRELSDALAKMLLESYQKGLSGLQAAVQGNQGVQAQQLFPASILGAVGGQQRAMEQAKLDEVVNRFYTQQDLPLLKAQQLLGLVSGMPGATGQTTVKGAQPGANPLMQGLGLAMTFMGMPGMGMGMGGLGGSGLGGAMMGK